MRSTKDPPENKRPTQTESEGFEKNIPSRWTGKKAGVGILISDKKDLTPPIKMDTEGHFIILKGRIHQEDIYDQVGFIPVMQG